MKAFICLCVSFFIMNTISLENYNEYFDAYFNEDIDNLNDITISFEDKNEMEYILDPKKLYIFSIENENYRYSISTDLKDNNILFFYNNNNNLESVSNVNYFEFGEKIYFINNYNLTESINIKVYAIPQYSILNGFETINENQYFFIKVKENSIAYFDCFDRNSKIYISNNTEKRITIDDEKINGKFILIKPNITYFIKNELYENCVSVFKKYLYPLNLTNEKIYIINDTINYLYLKANSSYILNFENNNMILMMSLSSKTLNAEIEIKESEESENIYYLNEDNEFFGEIIKNNYNELILNVKEKDSFIEFLSVFENNDIQIFEDDKVDDEKLSSKIITIDIIETQKNFHLKLFTNNGDTFNYSLSIGKSFMKSLDNEYKYIYTSNSNTKINSKESEINLEFLSLYKYFDSNGYISFSIFIDKKEEQDISISYDFFSEIDDLFSNYNPEKYELIIDYFKQFFDLYIYTDIAQNPPKMPDLPHEKINLVKKLEEELNIGNEMTYYELFQKLKQITCLTKDLHINFQSLFKGYIAYLPFDFIINKDENEQYRIFIEKNKNFDNFEIKEKEKEFIESHLKIPLKKINDIDPFDYIQNWSQFLSVKNVHAQFTFIIDLITGFSLSDFPVYVWNITSNEYEFDDNQILRMNYKIYPGETSNNEFNTYFMNIVKKSRFLFEIPSLGKIKENFLLSKGLKNNLKTEETLNWNFKIEDKNLGLYLKCRVDEINNVNVLVQNSFNLDYLESIRTILNCARLFYSNDFPIIIIESKNKGGNPNLAKIMIQVFQILYVERSYNSFRASYKKYFQNREIKLIDPETCEIIDLMGNLKEETDYYKNDEENISHSRTKPMQEINLQIRKALNNFREEFKNSTFLKKPNEIIIFTDSFSFSSASTLIKGFQNIGGAIIVGYFGNPKIKGIDLFDSSQSDSSLDKLNIQIEEFVLESLTTQEVFDEYKEENPIPREYTFNPVDFRVDIYSKYSDEIYSDFIKEGKNIFNKFKDGNYCNSKNEKFMMPDEKCRNLGENLHGGYKCKKEKDEWDKSKCIPYYCDIGYYFDKYQQKCIKECTYENQVLFLYENNYTNEFTIQKNEKYEIFTYNPEDYSIKNLFS